MSIGVSAGIGAIGGALNWLGTSTPKYKMQQQFLGRAGGGVDALNAIRDYHAGRIAGKDPIPMLPWMQFTANPAVAAGARGAEAEREAIASRATKLGIGPRSGRVQKSLLNANLRQAAGDQGAYTKAGTSWRQMLEQSKLGSEASMIDMAMKEQEANIAGRVAAFNSQGTTTSPLVGLVGGGLSSLLSSKWGGGRTNSIGSYYQSGPGGPGSYDYDAERGVAGY